ncbi:MAG: EAL domain-containing protein [Oscillospiraceae bacterium]|nr:EAL domain-containing protein [Oscillospiraceae bacterium]MBQ9982617.1 EAL domain-containing protein [Oscillospiraceae bacterium]
MKTYNLLHTSKESTEAFCRLNNLDKNKKYLIRIHTSEHNSIEALKVAEELSVLFPQACIAGTSAYAVICQGEVIEKGCIVSITEFEKSDVEVFFYDYDSDDKYAVNEELKRCMTGSKPRLVMSFYSNFSDIRKNLERMEEFSPDIIATGGVAAVSDSQSCLPFIFCKDRVSEHAVLCVVVCSDSDDFNVFGDVVVGHDEIGDVYSVTEVNGYELCKIENESAADWIRNFFGKSKEINDVLSRFSMVLQDDRNSNCFIEHLSCNDKILLYNKVSENTKFRMGYLNSMTTAIECREMCDKIEKTYAQTLFVYSSRMKRKHVENCSEWEVTPFNRTDISGAFLRGQIGSKDGKNGYFNGVSSFTAISEEESYVEIDRSTFDNLEGLIDDNRELINYVLKMQSESILKKNQILSIQIMEHEKAAINKIFMDEHSGLYNSAKFAFDNGDNKFNKICMISVEKGDVLKSYYGEAAHNEIMGENQRLICSFFGESDFNFYRYNENTIVVAARDYYDRKKFQKLVRTFYLDCGSFSVESLGITCLNNVAVVVDEYDMLMEKASSTLINGQKNGQRYTVYKSALQSSFKISEEMKWVEIISDAIKNNRVVPYFQPIYDNLEKKVTKFEALMRIIGRNGELYSPGQFLDIAKDYKLYPQMSMQMLIKVFNLFSNRKEIVSVNMSAYDINSEEMKRNIYELIGRIPNPGNFIFEIVESEELKDYEMVSEFVEKLNENGIKIAIDDFGSGYSNLVELARLEPDYIKIDGEIVRNINSSSIHKIIAETIVYMTSKLKTELVAEYVENYELQQTIIDMHIRYSQGYLFSKPLPYEEIDSYLEKFI